MKIEIPEEALSIIELLYLHKFDAFIVGGCVRDSLLKRTPNDWDICTDCKPNEMIRIFQQNGFKTIPTGLKHGTISIVINKKVFEVTTYRIEGEYINNRRPINVKFTNNLNEDLSRRDFTINSMAYSHRQGLVDPFKGRRDLRKGIIRAVGVPSERFKEDALRIIRGVRFATEICFDLHIDTEEGIKKNRELLANISKERINSELNKILLSYKPSKGFQLFKDLSLLDYTIPELKSCINFQQKNPHHDKDVFDHTMVVLDNTRKDLVLRWAALLHDIGKPLTFTEDDEGVGHFFNHHSIGSTMSKEILNNLKYDNKTIEQVSVLIKEHMLRCDHLTDKAVKRLISRVGKDNIDRLFMLQRADIQASKLPHDFSEVDYLEHRCKEIISNKEPLNVKDLEINGYDLIEIGVNPGKKMGVILDSLLELVLEKPELNTRKVLLSIVKENF